MIAGIIHSDGHENNFGFALFGKLQIIDYGLAFDFRGERIMSHALRQQLLQFNLFSPLEMAVRKGLTSQQLAHSYFHEIWRRCALKELTDEQYTSLKEESITFSLPRSKFSERQGSEVVERVLKVASSTFSTYVTERVGQ